MREFDNEEEAVTWMIDHVDDPYTDNERVAYKDDPESMEAYEAKLREGCCGFFDVDCVIDNRPACIGCNYGH